MKKKIIAFLMALVLLFTFVPVQAFALGDDLEEIANSWAIIADAAEDLNIGGTAASTTSFVDIFKSCMSVASTAGSMLTLVNGGVTFLRLIGVMEDPVLGRLDNILDKLDTMNTKMSEMDKKLDDMTQQMSRIEAKIDLNARVQKATDMENAWKDFSQRYMDDRLDHYMAIFDTTVVGAMESWFENETSTAREQKGINNNIIVLKYVKDEDGKFVLDFVNGNTIPESCFENERYVLLKAPCVPGKMTWNVNSYTADLTAALKANIATALDGDPDEYFSVCRYELPAKEDSEAIEALAADAAEALKYRVGSAAVRAKEDFASDIVYYFGLYCRDLLKNGDGMDARYKSFYLNYAFEGQVKNSIDEFSNQMILKTGVYSAFVSNVMGMTAVFTDSDKENMMTLFADTVTALDAAKGNALTGHNNYCYITNSLLDYVNVGFRSTVSARLVKDGVYWNYKGIDGTPITYSYTLGRTGTLLGDNNALLLLYVLQSDGLTDSIHNTLLDYAGERYSMTDFGTLVTKIGVESDLALDSGTWMECNYVCGDYFENVEGLYLNGLPEDASDKKILRNRKISGNVLELETGEPKANVVLHAVAGYGETSKWWFEDEIALFGGPVRNGYSSSMDSPTGYNRTYNLNTVSQYNALLSNPISTGFFSDRNGYDPLVSFREFSEELEEAEEPEVPEKPEVPHREHNAEGPKIVLGKEDEETLLGGTNPDTGAYVDPAFLAA